MVDIIDEPIKTLRGVLTHVCENIPVLTLVAKEHFLSSAVLSHGWERTEYLEAFVTHGTEYLEASVTHGTEYLEASGTKFLMNTVTKW